MLLEAAMSELCENAADCDLLQLLPHEHFQSRSSEQKPGAEPKEGDEAFTVNMSQNSTQHPFYDENPSQFNTGDNHNPLIPAGDAGFSDLLQDDDHRKLPLPAQRSRNVGSSAINPYDCDNTDGLASLTNHTANDLTNYTANDDIMANQRAISLLQEDQEFVNRVLNREPSNLGESSRYGGYQSTAAVAAGGVPFRWEAQPGKSKNPAFMIREEEMELLPLSLPPIRGISSTAAQLPAHMMSPSSSAAPSPRSLTGKMKSLITNHMRKPSSDHFSTILDAQKSPSKKSPHRRRRERKPSSLSASEYGSMASGSVSASPYIYSTAFKNGHGGAMQKNEESSYGPRASLNSCSDPCSSPYYFSPLSNSCSIMSPRASIAQSSTSSIGSISRSQAAQQGGSQASSRDSDSSISSMNSLPGTAMAASSGPAMLANCLLAITAMSDDRFAPAEAENGDQNGRKSPHFASSEMESVDEGLLTGTDYVDISTAETTMEDFINRGGPSMHRSFSASRVTFSEDFYRKPYPKSKYFSAQLSNLAQPKSHQPSSKQEINHYTANLDLLFPLKRPNGMEFFSTDQSPDDKQAYADALDTSLDCSVMTDNEELNSMVQSIMNDSIREDRPAQEVVMEAYNDENGFAYTPVASAFVFSPKKGASEKTSPAAMQYFKPSTSANLSDGATYAAAAAGNLHDGVQLHGALGRPRSILKKKYAQELSRHASFNVKTAAGYEDMVGSAMEMHQKSFSQSEPLKSSASSSSSSWRLAYVAQPKTLTGSSSQKISSVLLRFAEAEEKLYSSSKRHHGGMRSPAACMQPMCSFLGRALLCRSKLTSHAAGPLRT